MDTSSAFRAALAATPADYLAGILKQRNPGPDALGSRFTVPQTVETLQGALWEPYVHPEVAPGCQAYRAPIRGTLGIVALEDVPSDAGLVLLDGHATGFVEAVWTTSRALPEVDYTTAIVGQDEGHDVVFTMFPGPPVRPSSLPATEFRGQEITVSLARRLGFRWVKIRQRP